MESLTTGGLQIHAILANATLPLDIPTWNESFVVDMSYAFVLKTRKIRLGKLSNIQSEYNHNSHHTNASYLKSTR